jgi:hypothetical protein
MLKASRDHLDEVQETYFEHLRAASAVSGLLAKAGIACAVHAIVPGLCTRTASRCIAELSSNLNRRGVAEVQPEQARGVPRHALSS